ncbi:MAG: LPS export ABC transporter periplasmic protein LptC, partial [Ignavibacteria bacterium]
MSSIHFRRYILLFVCTILLSCEDIQQDKQVLLKDTIDPLLIPTHEIWDFSMAFTDSTRTRAILKSGKARVFETRNETLLDSGVYVQFMNAASKPAGFMTSASASINEVTRDMLAKGNVYVQSDSTNTILKTETLMWKEESRQFYTKDKIHIQTPTEIIDGYGMESDIWLKNYRIFNDFSRSLNMDFIFGIELSRFFFPHE